MELNPSQMKAVEATEGYVRVIAGAGSGKTRALSSRFAYLVLDLGILPSNILCVTFTNKSAAEMRRRIHRMTQDEDTGMICTFHGLCNTILLEESHAIHYPKSFMVADNADIDEFLKLIYEERGLTSRDMTFSKARDMIEMKKLQYEPDYYKDLVSLSTAQLYDKYMRSTEADDIIFYGYLYQQKKSYALDYNDLIILTLYIFENNPEIAEKWQQRMEYIMIDEFQDIDDLQYRLMEQLAKIHKNLFVVGDPDQTIYTWRGARVEYLTRFDEHFVPCQTIFLNENYRSSPQVLAAANSLIANNVNRIEKNLISMQPDGPKVKAAHYTSANAEAKGIIDQIQHYAHKGYEYRDMAILYRAHYMSRSIEDALIEAKIPYVIYSGVPFFSRKEIKDVMSYVRMLLSHDDLDFIRTINVPKRNIGKSRIAFLQEYARDKEISLYEALKENLETDRFKSTKAAEYIDLIETYDWQNQPVSKILSDLMEKSGYEKMLRLEGSQERLDNLAELKQAASDYEISWGEDTTLEGWVRHVALFSASDNVQTSNKVQLMTIHTAKGLEFDCVLMAGMNEGMFPTRQVKTLQAMEEERRLAFVAMTRAKRELYLSEAQGNLHGHLDRYPSRFLLEVDPDALAWDPKPDDSLIQAAKRLIASKPITAGKMAEDRLESGDLIEHPVFGPGVVLETDWENGRYTVLFEKLNTKRTLSTRAKVKKTGHGPGRLLH